MERYRFEAEKQLLLESLPQPLAIYQYLDGQILTIVLSEGFMELFGYSDREQAYRDMNKDLYKYNHPDDVIRLSKAAEKFAKEGGDFDIIYRSKTRDHSIYHIVHAKGKHHYMENGERIAYVWYTDEGAFDEESNDQKEVFYRSLNNALHEESLLRASEYDRLTGMLNMTSFFKLAEEAKKKILFAGEQAVLLYFDFTGMKFYNSKYSYTQGDQLLQSFGRLLMKKFGSDCCCHVSGDHFAAFSDEKHLEEILQELLSETRELNNGNSLPIRIGIYSTMIEDVPVAIACDRAKYACDSLKNRYESAYQYFRSEMRENAVRRQYILSHLDEAIAEGWIKVYYQPIVRTVNGRVCDEEALARWDDPNEGLLSPDKFIPFLEEAGIIYKLDLCVLDQVLKKIRHFEDAGLYIVPQSINISRSDFTNCDIVEEIRKRVDEAHIDHSLITIEITESILGSNFDFMKDQIRRFRQLGFPIWLDDFGSGYSSLDVLQSVSFDLIKFDMSFMRKLDESESNKIMMTELMKMAIALNIETVCEGVENQRQVDFLKVIGCSKLQGYFYQKPIPMEQILAKYENGIQIGFENPLESAYYESVSRVSLFDLSALVNENSADFRNFFNTVPIVVMELSNDHVRYVRYNQSYCDFVKRFFNYEFSDSTDYFPDSPIPVGQGFLKQALSTKDSGKLLIFDEKLPDGSVIHSLIRRVSENPVSGMTAVVVSVLSISEPSEGTSYAGIARALAADYYNIYYVDLNDDSFIEYRSPIGKEELAVERSGKDFFLAAKRDTMLRVYEEDRDFFLSIFTKENIIHELDKQGVFTATYRLIDSGSPVYVNMKITRMVPDINHIIIGISVIDSQMKQQELIERLQREEHAHARVMALSGDYLSLYTIDPKNDHYFQYSITKEYESLGIAKRGEDFFGESLINIEHLVHPDDLQYLRENLNKENVLKEVAENYQYQLHYRLLIKGEVQPVSLKFVSVREKDGEKLIAGVRAWKKRQREK